MAKETDRDKYLKELAEDNGVPMYVVRTLADLLGPDEDYDGLVTAVEDYCEAAGG